MGLLDLNRILLNEGLLDTIKIAWNIAVNPSLRQRILQNSKQIIWVTSFLLVINRRNAPKG